MTLSDLSLKRPIAAIVFSLLIVLMGVVGFNGLGVRLYPSIDPPVITVSTSYTGANSEIIESQITEPLEKAINGIEGVKSVVSQSSTGSSRITVEFDLGSDLEKAANDVRDRVSQAMRQLPQDIDAAPTVTKADADSDPVIMLIIQSSRMNALELSDYAENILQEKFQTIPGVSSVSIFGQQKPAMRLWLDPARLAAYHLTASDVRTALSRENVERPGGKIRGQATELLVKTNGRLNTEEEFNNMIIKKNGDQIVRLMDIGEAVLGPQSEESGGLINGVPGAMLAVLPLPGANDIQIADEFYKRLEQVRASMPAGMELHIGRDRSVFVRQSVFDVAETLFIAIILVVAIIFLFFRNWIIAIRPLIDIPVSLIGTFFVMYLAGYTINVLTLLGIVLATGLVVDDGIVVTENIFKKREQGMDKWKAAFEGTREIFFAVISTSLTLAIVFLPIMFLEGFTGRLFREFGVVLAAAVLISAFVSLTLTPVLNVKLGGGLSHHSRFYLMTEPYFQKTENLYKTWLQVFFKKRWISIGVLVWCLIMVAGVARTLKSELSPLEDRSFIRTSVRAAEGIEFGTMKRMMDDIALTTMDSVPENRFVMSRYGGMGSSGSNSGMIMTFLKEPDERRASQQQIVDRLTKLYAKVPNARVVASQEPTIATSTSRGMPVQFVLQNLNFDKLKQVLPRFLEEAQNSLVLSNADVDLKFNKPEINISVDRLKAATLGVSEKDVSDALSSAYSGSRYGYFLRNNKQYYIIGQVDRKDRDAPADLSSLYVPSSNGSMVQLDNVITMEENSNPPILYHYNRYKSATISANLNKGYTQGDGIEEMQRIADKVLDDSFDTALAGSSRDFAESTSNIVFSLILALLLVYLVLAAQFESFRDPLTIMLTVPMALAGAMISLKLTGQTLNIFSEIGMILLVGIVTKNGILIVEFANQKRLLGLDKKTAAFEAAIGRFRPILMTSLATISGAMPIALALGSGAESRVSMGIVVVFGLLFALILTLFVIPVMYTFISGDKIKRI